MEQKKKQMIAMFILITFVFSGFAFAIISSLTGGGTGSGEELQPIYNQPLPASDEQAIISSGKVVVKIFASQNCDDCGPANSEVLKLFQKLGQAVIVEQIDTTYFPEEIQTNNLKKFPTIIILGKGSDRLEGLSTELLQKVCSQFSSKPAACG